MSKDMGNLQSIKDAIDKIFRIAKGPLAGIDNFF